MFLRTERLEPKILVGLNLGMNLVNNRTAELWGAFMPRRKEIKNRVSTELINLQVYADDYYVQFNPARNFEAWALVEVNEIDELPTDMSRFELQGGLYAVFMHKGATTNHDTFPYIFNNWLPKSIYKLDSRPHFEVLGNKYKNNSPESEEEVWIPVKLKSN